MTDLQMLREDLGLSQEQFAAVLGVGDFVLQLVDNCGYGLPPRAESLAQALQRIPPERRAAAGQTATTSLAGADVPRALFLLLQAAFTEES